MRLKWLLLLLCCLLLSGCTAHDPLMPMASTATGLNIPAPEASELPPQEEAATLWFRFGEEALLAPESRSLNLSPTAPYELTLLQTLVGGPSASSTELSGLFPSGTRVTATYRQGRRLFVTLSRQIMNDWADEPDGWQLLPEWQQEVPLRRMLAMQSIAATVTENCDVDEVVILIEQGQQITDSLRLRQRYYRTGGDENALAAPLRRDEALLLTPTTTLSVILQCWSERDWSRLYPFIARTDPATGLERPGSTEFAALMDALPHLTQSSFHGGSISPNGLYATFSFDAALMQDGHTSAISSGVIRLCRERGIWRIGLSQLIEREVPGL